MSDRGASAQYITKLTEDQNKPFYLVEMHLSTSTVYMTDAHRDVDWGGNTYEALGDLLNFSDIEEQLALNISQVTGTLSGVRQEYLTYFLTEDYIDRTAKIYRGYWGDNWQMEDDPLLLFEGKMDSPVIMEDYQTKTASISITASSSLVDFEKRPGRHTSHDETQIYFAGDNFFNIPDIRDIKWGKN